MKGVDADDVAEHVALARAMRVQFGSVAGEEQVLLDGDDVTRRIRTEEAGAGASRVAAWPAVRAALTGPPESLRLSPPDWSPTGGIWARSSFRAPS